MEQIHKVDYLQIWGDLEADFALEKTYTWLDWLIIENIIANPNFNFVDLTDEQKLQLS